jgi:uncharacterized membrane protein
MISVTLYSRAKCELCEKAKSQLMALQDLIPHRLTVIDIDSEPSIHNSYAMDIPVVEVGSFKLKAPFTQQDIKRTLMAAVEQHDQLVNIDNKAFRLSTSSSQTISTADHFSYWLSKHYLLVFNLFLLLYVGLPFLAPIFKKVGWNGPAEVVYKVYSPLCHQWAFRSLFLFGEQAYYPHAAAKVPGVLTFEKVSGITDVNDPSRSEARLFEGGPLLGYKVALCERDVAIWGAMALFGLLFAVTGRRLPKMHWVVWVLVGMLPIGLDGFSQLFSQIPIAFIQTYLPYRESTPFLRVLTGFLFGLTTAWFIFPLMEETMVETRLSLSKRFASFKLH